MFLFLLNGNSIHNKPTYFHQLLNSSQNHLNNFTTSIRKEWFWLVQRQNSMTLMGLSLLLHRLRKLQKRRQSPRRRTRRQSSITPVHLSVHPSILSLLPPFLSFIFLSFSQFSLSLSSSLNNLLSAHHHQRNIFISEFVNTGSGF